MIRIVLGYTIAITFGLGMVGGFDEFFESVSQQKPFSESIILIIFSLLFSIIGVFLIKSGKKSRNEILIIQEYALKKQNSFGFVNTTEVAEETGFNIVTVTKILKNFENKDFIKIDVAKTSDKVIPLEGHKSNKNQSINGTKYRIKKKHLECLFKENLISEEEYKTKCKEISIHLSENSTGSNNNESYNNVKSQNEVFNSLRENDSKPSPA
jgi:hypothetical protein